MKKKGKPLIPGGKINTATGTPLKITLDNGEVVEMIPNPLPVPKRKARGGMEFPYEIDESKMEFDHEIPEDKMKYDVE